MKRSSLRLRLANLERQEPHHHVHRIILAVYGEPDAAVTGFVALGCETLRLPGEDLIELRDRALAATEARILTTIY